MNHPSAIVFAGQLTKKLIDFAIETDKFFDCVFTIKNSPINYICIKKTLKKGNYEATIISGDLKI